MARRPSKPSAEIDVVSVPVPASPGPASAGPAWSESPRQAMERFIAVLERDLPPDATLLQIETAVFEHHRALLSEVMQALANRRASFPPGPGPD